MASLKRLWVWRLAVVIGFPFLFAFPTANASPVTVRCEAYEYPTTDISGKPPFLGVFYGIGNTYQEAVDRADHDAFANHIVRLPRQFWCREITRGPAHVPDPESVL
jgi:hypothetical protein